MRSRAGRERAHPASLVRMTPEDAWNLSALRRQHAELGAVLARLESARGRYVLPPPDSWWGPARRGYDIAFDGLIRTLDAGVERVREALLQTAAAIDGLQRE